MIRFMPLHDDNRRARERKKLRRVSRYVYCEKDRHIHRVFSESVCAGPHRPVYIKAFEREGEF